MITKEEIYKKAFEKKKKALKEKTARRDMLLAAAYSAQPRFRDIDRELSSIGAKAAIEALSGGNVTELKRQSEALANEKKALLDKYGVKDIEYDCSVCNDTGYVNGKICGCVKKIASFLITEELLHEMPIDLSLIHISEPTRPY